MITVIKISDRGVLTLPKEMRHHLGANGNAQILAEETDALISDRPHLLQAEFAARRAQPAIDMRRATGASDEQKLRRFGELLLEVSAGG